MSNVNAMLAELNTMRAERNQPALKSWKGSTAALEQTINAYKVKKVEPAVAEGAYPNAKVAEHSTELKGTDAKARDAIKKANTPKADGPFKRAAPTQAKAKATKPAKAKATKPASDNVSLADIARELGIEPKLARAKARRSDEITKLATGDTWAFKPADVVQVKKLLK